MEKDGFLPLILAQNQRELLEKVTSRCFMAPPTASFKDNSAKLYALRLVMTIAGSAIVTTSGAIITAVHLEDEWVENV